MVKKAKASKVYGEGGEERMERECQPPMCWREVANWNSQRILKRPDDLGGCFVRILMSCPEFQSGNYTWPIQIPLQLYFAVAFFEAFPELSYSITV